MLNLIIEYEDYNKSYVNHHIYRTCEDLITNYNYQFINRQDIINNIDNLYEYFMTRYTTCPKNILIVMGVVNYIACIEKLSLICDVSFIIDDIHHGKSLRVPRQEVFKHCKYLFMTYGYLSNLYFDQMNGIVFCPHSAAYDIEFNNCPIDKVLLTGALNKDLYPNRDTMYILSKNRKYGKMIDYHKIDYSGYRNEEGIGNATAGLNYYKLLNKYLCCVCDDINDDRKYLLAKVFEITATGSLLLSFNKNTSHVLKQLGFEDGEHYISCCKDDIGIKITYVLNVQNRDLINKIRKNGYELTRKYHTFRNRSKLIDSVFNNEQLGFEYDINTNTRYIHKNIELPENTLYDHTQDPIMTSNLNLIIDYGSTENMNSKHHLVKLCDYLISHYGYIKIDRKEIETNIVNLEKYFMDTYGRLPKNMLIVMGVTYYIDYIQRMAKLCNVSFIIDDIHHSSRLNKPRYNVFTRCKYIFMSYAYFSNRYFKQLNGLALLPHAIAYEVPFNNEPINQILLTGHIDANLYPNRMFVYNLTRTDTRIYYHVVDYFGYRGGAVNKSSNPTSGEAFYKLLNKYICCVTDDANHDRKYLIAKFFEITGSGALLLAFNKNTKHVFELLGYKENTHYISCTQSDFLEKVTYVLDPKNRKEIDKIRKNGYELTTKKHSYKNRAQFIDKMFGGNCENIYITDQYSHTKYILDCV